MAITAERRERELATLLQRHGARVISAPAIHLLPIPDDGQARRDTVDLIGFGPTDVIITTAVGLRGWLQAAAGWGLAEALQQCLDSARIYTRGPKARGAVRGAGLREVFSPASESTDGVVDHLLDQDLDGARIGVQLHGDDLTEARQRLRRSGAELMCVRLYRWEPPADPARLQALIRRVIAGDVDAVLFTSAPAVRSTLDTAMAMGQAAPLVGALGRLTVGCVGEVTAAPLREHGLRPVIPARSRLADLVRSVGAAR